jgi:DNA-binding ferritin-like protein (Dps family)
MKMFLTTGKMKLFMLLGLTILFLVQALVFILIRPDWNPMLWIIFSMIIVMALAGSLFSFVFLRRTEKRLQGLPEDYVQVFMNAKEAIALNPMSKAMKSEIQGMILEIFEHAAKADREVDEVIGGNLDTFLKGFIQAAGKPRTLTYWLSMSSALFIGYLLFMKLYKVLRHGSDLGAFSTEVLDLGITLTYALISFTFFPWLMMIIRKAAKEQWQGLKRVLIMLPFIIPFSLMGILIGVDNPGLRAFLDQPIVLFPNIIVYSFGIMLFIVSLLFMKLSLSVQIKRDMDRF